MFDYFIDILEFDVAQFHFLRPLWLWAFIPVVLIALLVHLSHKEDNSWMMVIAPHLRPFMFTRGSQHRFASPMLFFSISSVLIILGLSGPTWSKVDVPGAKSEAVLMIALDASLSMLAEDVPPNRLERAKFKVRDLLEENPGARIGLFAYAGTAHTVVPFCSDYRLVKHHLESISPGIMPMGGSNLSAMIQLADSVMQTVVAPSSLFLITDNIPEEAVVELERFVDNSNHSLQLLAMATVQGATIPMNEDKMPVKDNAGNVVISKLDPEVLYRLQSHPKINVHTLTLDNSDMEQLASMIRQNLNYQSDDEASEEQWKDMGYLFVILLVLLFPFWFRKGWMINYAWLPFVVFLLPSCGEKLTWDDIWCSDDYQGQLLYESEDYGQAATTYQSAVHQGVAYYKDGNYDAAAYAFSQDSSVTSLYNLSLSYSQLGRYDEAMAVITLAMEKSPDNQDLADMLNETEKTLYLIDSIKAASGPVVLQEKDEKEAEKLEERKASSKDEELTSDTEVDELPKGGKRVTDEVETDQRKAEELEEVPDDFQSESNNNSPQNILLREISSEPSEFLRRRFKYQYNKYHATEALILDQW